jgi:hypothetical protein
MFWEVEEKASPLSQLLSPDSSTKLNTIGFYSPKNLMLYIILGDKKEETKAPTTPTLELMILLHLLKSSWPHRTDLL